MSYAYTYDEAQGFFEIDYIGPKAKVIKKQLDLPSPRFIRYADAVILHAQRIIDASLKDMYTLWVKALHDSEWMAMNQLTSVEFPEMALSSDNVEAYPINTSTGECDFTSKEIDICLSELPYEYPHIDYVCKGTELEPVASDWYL